MIGNAEPADVAGVEAGVGGGFQHGRAEAAHQGRFFDRDDEATVSRMARRIVSASSGLTKRALITPTSRPSSRSSLAAVEAVGQKRAAADDRAVIAGKQDFALAEFERRALAGESFSAAAFGIANRTGAVVFEGELEHLRQVGIRRREP